MIKQLKGHLSEVALEKIKEAIIQQYKKYKEWMGSEAFRNLFDEEYAPHKRQFILSWAISSAFPSGVNVADLEVTLLKYGRGHKRPCLSNEKGEVYVLNDSTEFDSEYLKERYAWNGDDFSRVKLFCYIKFKATAKQLTEVELCLPDECGNVVAREVLITRAELKLVA